MSKHIVNIGDLVLDLILPVSLPVVGGSHQDVNSLTVEAGGASNFMIAAARLGARVSTIGALGGDVFGYLLLDILRAEGVNIDAVQVDEGVASTTVITLIDLENKTHSYLGSYGAGPVADYTPAVDSVVRSADAIFLQGYTLYEQRVYGLAMYAIERAREAGIPVYLDAGPPIAHVPQERIEWALRHCDVLLLTEDEIPLVTSGRRGDPALRLLLGYGIGTLVVKQGAAGCTLVRPEGKMSVPGFNVPVIDSVGAGDTFNAAVIYALLHGYNWRQAAKWGNAMGAAAVQKFGAGRNVPTCAEFAAMLRQADEPFAFNC